MYEKEILNEIKNQGFIFEPNEKVVYSNSAYFLLRKIVEKKFKKDYYKIVNQEIVRPLGLINFASVNSNPTNVFKSYQFQNGWKEVKEVEFKNIVGVGDIASTTKDLNIVINSLFENKILKKESVKVMKPIIGQEDWGRGLALFPYDDHLFFGHGGDAIGVHTRLIYNPKDRLSISYATNGERIPSDLILENLVNIIYNKVFDFPEIK